MAASQARLSSFTMVMAGMVLVFAGLGALGIWLAAGGEDAFGPALVAAIAMMILLGTGMMLLVVAYRHRGGLLEETPTAIGVATHREDYR